MPPKRKFRDAWLQDDDFKDWLSTQEDNPERCFCKVCGTNLRADITCIKKHKNNECHKTKIARIENQPDIPSTSRGNIDDEVTRAEIKLATFFAEHNIAVNCADHLIDLLKDIFSNPQVLQRIKLKRSKTTHLINETGNIAHQELINTLKTSKFSIIIDETTDVRTSKTCAVLVRYFDKEKSFIQTRILNLLETYGAKNTTNVGSTEQNLFVLIEKLFKDYEIPFDNLVGFASDAASNIMGNSIH